MKMKSIFFAFGVCCSFLLVLKKFNTVSYRDIKKKLNMIKSNACELDAINLKMTKLVLNYCIQEVTHIINYSLMSEVFPKLWKVTLVTPLPKVDGTVSLRTILKESDTLAKRMSKAEETIKNLKKFAKNNDPSQSIDERVIADVLVRAIDDEVKEENPDKESTLEDAFNYVYFRNEKDKGKQFRNKLKRGIKVIKNRIKDVLTEVNNTTATQMKKFKFKESYKQPQRFHEKKRKRMGDNDFRDVVMKSIDHILLPSCSGSKYGEKQLRKVAKKIHEGKAPIVKAVAEIDNLYVSNPESIEQIIRDAEKKKIQKVYSDLNSNKFLITIKNFLQLLSDALYQFLAYLSSNDLFGNVLPGFQGIINVHTTVIRFLIIKLFCLIDSFGLDAVGEPLKEAILQLFDVNMEDDGDLSDKKPIKHKKEKVHKKDKVHKKEKGHKKEEPMIIQESEDEKPKKNKDRNKNRNEKPKKGNFVGIKQKKKKKRN